MRTIRDCIRLLLDTAEMLADRGVRCQQYGYKEEGAEQLRLARSYREAANYLEAQMKEDRKKGK